LPAAGPNFCLTTQSRINTDDALLEANREGISFLPGSVCYPGIPERNSLRISFASLPVQKLNEGIVQLSKVLEEILHMNSASPEGHVTI
jgi:DNA-binding transcriptional MocR family regulator